MLHPLYVDILRERLSMLTHNSVNYDADDYKQINAHIQ